MIYLSLIWDRLNKFNSDLKNTEYIDLRFANEAYISKKKIRV